MEIGLALMISTLSTGYTVFRDHSFEVTRGEIVRATRVDDRNDPWLIKIHPDLS